MTERGDDRVELAAALSCGLAHDLRNFLAVAETSVFVAKKRIDDRTVVSDQLERMSVALRSAQELLSTTLAFARGEPPVLVPRRVRDIVETALRFVGPESRSRVTVAIDPIDLAVDVAPCLVNAALLNLVKNAVEASPSSAIHVRGSGASGQIRIEVEDDGPGFVARGDRDTSALRSTKEGGTGLGLRAARAAAVLHGGDLHIEQPERGARVVLLLGA